MSALLAGHARYVANGFIQGQLFEVADYPGAVESRNPMYKVVGDVFQMQNSDWLLQQLDEYEECSADYATPHEYTRKLLTVTLVNDKQITAWCYVYNWDVTGLLSIDSGNYLAFKTGS
jgi:gamma-glutamylcyclotransferase (GGCT)/AIG2-like uncharacterized protein YtfP